MKGVYSQLKMSGCKSVEEVPHGGQGGKGPVGTGGEFGEVWEPGQFQSQLLLHSRHPLQLRLVVLCTRREERANLSCKNGTTAELKRAISIP